MRPLSKDAIIKSQTKMDTLQGTNIGPPCIYYISTHLCYCFYCCYCCCCCRFWTAYIKYSETSLIRHSMEPENNFGLGGCWIIEFLLQYLCMVTVPHIKVGLERMLDYRGVGLARFHCNWHISSKASCEQNNTL